MNPTSNQRANTLRKKTNPTKKPLGNPASTLFALLDIVFRFLSCIRGWGKGEGEEGGEGEEKGKGERRGRGYRLAVILYVSIRFVGPSKKRVTITSP